MGLLNSKLCDWFLKKISTQFRGSWYSYESRYISKIPIKIVNLKNKAEKELHDRLVTMVEQMLEMCRRFNESQEIHSRKLLKCQIETTDRRIDRLVYQLYDLTEEEIKIAEDSVK